MNLNYNAVETINITDFAKLSLTEQCRAIKEMGIFLESYMDDISFVKVYYLSGFFVEVTVGEPELGHIEITPYRTGYKTEHYKHILFKSFKPVELRKVA